MANSLLEIGSILPPLLEQQISPPNRIRTHHLGYLQRWREYLSWLWAQDSNEEADRVCIQNLVDELISTILLINFVKQVCPTAIPSLKEALEMADEPTSFSLCRIVYNQVSCRLLKAIFNPDLLNKPMIKPPKEVELSSLVNISEVLKSLCGSRTPITLFGDFHQLCLDRPVTSKRIHQKGSNRRSKGIYYTPAALVDYIVFDTLKKVFRKLEPAQIQNLRILDPSCGFGAFLVATTRFMLKWFEGKYNNRRQPLYLSPQRGLELLESVIYGTDIDKQAINWTRRLFLLTVWDFYIKRSVNKNDIRNLRIPSFEDNIICGDFLEKQSFENKSFHVIIGGPPFVRLQELCKSDPVKVTNYKLNFRTARNGQFDLYMLFIEKAIKLLADQGYLSMSVSNTFLRSESGRVLRKLIAETCAVNEIVEFEDSKLYPNALVQVAAIVLQKTAERGTTEYVFVKGKGGLRRKLSGVAKQDDNVFLKTRNLPATACASGNWYLRSESAGELLNKVELRGLSLGKLPINIHLGVATGADRVFLLKSPEELNSKSVLAESRFLEDVFVFESSILRPILRGRHIKEYICPEPKTLCIFPYDKTGSLIPEDMLRTEFPHTYRYLKSCQPYLSSRKLKDGQSWYAFRNENISQFIQSPKIVASVVNSGGGFTLDHRQHLFCNNSVILLCPDKNIVNSYFLLAVLNSRVFRTWARHRMPTLGSGWYSYRVGILRKFPVPILQNRQDSRLFEKIAEFSARLLNKELDERERVNILSYIDNMVGGLYGASQSRISKYNQE